MRKHDIHVQIDSGIPDKYIQDLTNIYTATYIKKTLNEGGLPKEVQLNVIEKLIESIKTNNVNI